MPIPSTTNTASISAVPPASANPSAAPMNGAVHGEAIARISDDALRAAVDRMAKLALTTVTSGH